MAPGDIRHNPSTLNDRQSVRNNRENLPKHPARSQDGNIAAAFKRARSGNKFFLITHTYTFWKISKPVLTGNGERKPLEDTDSNKQDTADWGHRPRSKQWLGTSGTATTRPISEEGDDCSTLLHNSPRRFNKQVHN